jgi:opacity protein-like surface antigen
MLAPILASLHRLPTRMRSALCVTSIALLAMISAAPAARGQATYTADRIDGLSVFGAYTYLNTDYGQNDPGYMFGADYTHSIHSRFIVPSIEVRYIGSTGPSITEDSFLGGLKVETHFRHLHPYAGFLIGYGVINYVKFNANDNSIAYAVAVGADYNITRQFAVKIDAQEQFWKLGHASSELTPEAVSVGVLYRIPSFRGRNK